MSDVELAFLMLLVFGMVTAVLLLRWMSNAPVGHEDSSGFHYGEPARRE